ncbi:origin recognition complex subunit 5 C-terminus-domain-containing protein [Gautieria morchelliformis]|nr:origin recognition complex subunit 5 C-terminus-domain-containing protein [Gautieria morchelliformis]
MDVDVDALVATLARAHPGRHALLRLLATLFTTAAPPSIHVHAPLSPAAAAPLVRAVLAATRTPHAAVHAAECLSPRLFFDRVLHALAAWRVDWHAGCAAFAGGRYSRGVDAFVEGLRAIARERAPQGGNENMNMVLVVEHAERLREKLPQLVVPLTRMAELSGLPFTTVFVSEVSWFDLRPPYGAAIDPLLIPFPPLSTRDAVSALAARFPAHPAPAPAASLSPYSPHLAPLYAHYASALHSVCAPFLADEHELAYIAAACWPGFVAPLLADWRAHASSDEAAPAPPDADALPLPGADARMRLLRYFTPALTRALEALYPRTQHAAQWAAATAPPPGLTLSALIAMPMTTTSTRGPDMDTDANADADTEHHTAPKHGDGDAGGGGDGHPHLTTVAKYVLVAAFLASVNPPKTDARLLGRAPDERAKKGRRGGRGGPRKSRGGGRWKVPQRLVGPAAVPLDRLLAVLGALMEEHDVDGPTLGAARDEDGDGEAEAERDTEMAVGRIQVSATISQLVAQRLLHRTTPPDRLDAPPTFKCGVSQARAFQLAREVGIGSLAEFMWDAS